MRATREQVYGVIDDERDYQEQRWSRPQHNHSATEYLVYIEHYVRKAFAQVSTEDNELGALDNLRKIAALAVAAMEEHGIFERKKRGKCGHENPLLNADCTICTARIPGE